VSDLLRRLWSGDEAKDLEVVSASGSRLHCHRAILAIVSPFLAEVVPGINVMTLELPSPQKCTKILATLII
jgi:hypothetical protein